MLRRAVEMLAPVENVTAIKPTCRKFTTKWTVSWRVSSCISKSPVTDPHRHALLLLLLSVRRASSSARVRLLSAPHFEATDVASTLIAFCVSRALQRRNTQCRALKCGTHLRVSTRAVHASPGFSMSYTKACTRLHHLLHRNIQLFVVLVASQAFVGPAVCARTHRIAMPVSCIGRMDERQC